MFDNKDFRLILSSCSDAKTNMSIDKALAKAYKSGDLPILRLYTWENSFTVGLSQNTDEYSLYKKQYNNNCAKRITGGGVLFHGHDISYSLVLPSEYFSHLNVKQSYEKICQFLLTFYNDLGLEACFAKDSKEITLSKNEFCQVGFEAYDILVNGTKIGGNAQKRSKKMIFQHGSVPVKKTTNDIKLGASLEDFNINLSFKEIESKLIDSFKKSFNINFKQSQLTELEKIELNNILEGN